MAAVDQTLTVKGTPVKSLLKFIEQELTTEQREQVFSKLPEPYGERFRRGTVLVSETVPVSVLNRFTEEAANAKGEPVEAFARRAGRAGASDALTGVYRLFAMVLTPTALLSRAGSMWSSLYSQGQMKVESEEANFAKLKLVDFRCEAAGCARITGWIERMTEMTGNKNPRITHVRCSAKGAEACEWDLRW